MQPRVGTLYQLVIGLPMEGEMYNLRFSQGNLLENGKNYELLAANTISSWGLGAPAGKSTLESLTTLGRV